MSREVIAIDIDEVLSSEVDAIIAFSNQRLGQHLTYDDFKAPGEYWGYYERLWADSGEDPSQLFNEFLNSEHKSGQVIRQQVLEILKELKVKYELEIITSRTNDFKEITLQMIEEFSPSIFNDIHFVELWNEPDLKATKAHICKEIGAGYLIDDSVEHCNIAAEAGITPLLFGNWGWNREKEIHPDVVRVADWIKVREYFDV